MNDNVYHCKRRTTDATLQAPEHRRLIASLVRQNRKSIGTLKARQDYIQHNRDLAAGFMAWRPNV